MTIIAARALTVRHPGASSPALEAVDFDLAAGELVAIVGMNGSGKSTLLAALAGMLEPAGGSVDLLGPGDVRTPIRRMPRRRLAQNIAIMHQTLGPVPGLRVGQLIEQGRYPWRGALGMLASAGPDYAEDALATVGLSGWADREIDRLSGGERQRVRLALALAQRTPVLLLDEPTAHLDLHQQLAILDLVRRLQRQLGLAVTVVLHDLEHAARIADRIVALRDGHIVADGPPQDVLSDTLLADAFDVTGRVVHDPDNRLRTLIDDPITSDAPAPSGGY